MTREQEIANLKVIIEYEKQEYQRSIQKAPNEVKTVLGQIMDIHLKALEKQIPMKPVIEQGAPSYYGGAGICRDYCGCPKCGEEVGRGDDKANYCPECGQKLKWEEE